MTMFNNLLKVIFWLTTIVAATDCCYSQILPRLNQNLVLIVQQKSEEIDAKMIAATTTTTTATILNMAEEVSSIKQHQQQQQQQNPDDTYFFQIEIDKYLKHIKDFINSIAINPNKTKTGNVAHMDSNIDDNHHPRNKNNFIKSTTMTIYDTKQGNIIRVPSNINATATKTTILKNLTTTINVTSATAAAIATGTVPAIVTTTTTSNGNDNDDMKYNFLELYTFMSDTLSTSCSGEYASQYCLNNGQCFVHLVGLFYCKCAEGYVGERCESKYIYAMSGGYRSNSGSSGNSNSNSNSGTLIRSVEEKKPRILSARIIMPLHALIFLTILYLSLSLLWSYKSQCVKTHHNVTTQSSRHLIY